MLVSVIFFFLQRGRQRDSRHCFCKTIPKISGAEEKEDIVKSLGKPGFKVHTMCIRVFVRCRDSGHRDSATLLCLKLI